MDHYAGIDVSLEQSSVCVVDAAGAIVREAKVASEPEALIGFLGGLPRPVARVGLEAGPLSQWLQAALVKAGYDAVLLETRHRKGGALGHDREDGPQRRPRYRAAPADGLGPAGARQGGAGPKRCGRCSWHASSCRPRCAT